MDYQEISVKITPLSEEASDVLAAMLGEIGFESFVPSEEGLVCYVQEELFSNETFLGVFANFPMDVHFHADIKKIEGENWNEEWEKHYFNPIVVEGECVIHSSFHTDVPKAKYDIVIDPKMSFGTGHHETTYLILSEILKVDFRSKSVLDMGCGTAVLAILAAMKGAEGVVAIDIDQWCYDNSQENIELNGVPFIEVRLGGAELLGDRVFDVVFANINRNILLQDMAAYASVMQCGSEIFFSGFYTQDLDAIKEEAERNGLTFVVHNERNNWVAARFIKE